MAQVVLHKYSETWVEYKFKCRNNLDIVEYIEEIKSEINQLCALKFTLDELNYLSSIPFLKKDFIEYLRMLKLNPSQVDVGMVEDGLYGKKELSIVIEGPWISTIWFEVPLLAIVSEVWGRHNNIVQTGMNKFSNKIKYLKNTLIDPSYIGFKFADFGTRRRYSYHWQREHIVPTLSAKFKDNFVGTSNVLIAKELDLKPIGTMAHEFIMAHQQLTRLVDSQKAALQAWSDEYRGELGIALSDTVGIDAFLKDFDLYFAKLFDGARHDSGDPFEWGYKWSKHLKDLGIDPKTKHGVFSDGLTFEKALNLYETFGSVFETSFGIGTYLTNDMGMTPPNIVIKMTKCNGSPVAKISDSPGKQMCDNKAYLLNLREVYGLKEKE